MLYFYNMNENTFTLLLGLGLVIAIVGLAYFGLNFNVDTAGIASGVSNI